MNIQESKSSGGLSDKQEQKVVVTKTMQRKPINHGSQSSNSSQNSALKDETASFDLDSSKDTDLPPHIEKEPTIDLPDEDVAEEGLLYNSASFHKRVDRMQE